MKKNKAINQRFSAFVLVLLGGVGVLFAEDVYAKDSFFKNEEGYHEGVCKLPTGEQGESWSFLDGKELRYVCCPKGQLPTGNTDRNQPSCAQPLPERGSCKAKGVEKTFCMGPKPFVLCCPDGQMATCDPDARNPQCANHPLKGLFRLDDTPGL